MKAVSARIPRTMPESPRLLESSAVGSSPGTTMSTATPGSATSRRRRSTSAAPRPPKRLAQLPSNWHASRP
jgi:hypothetical protein